MKPKKAFFIVLLFCFAALAFGQNLLNNPDYQKAVELQALADQALQAGDYDKAYEYSAEAETYALKAKELADRERAKYRANTLISYLTGRFNSDLAKQLEAAYPDEFNTAKTKFANAKTAYAAEDYPTSVSEAEGSRADFDALEALLTKASPTPTPEVTPGPTPTPTEEAIVLPRYYKVRYIPADRDCLWNIAGYPFIYNNPWMWKKIYEANKDKLPMPANPNLIYPNITLEIPPIAGEIREGTYNPSKTYPSLKKNK